VRRNREVINKKKREYHKEHGHKYKEKKKEYDRTHKAERAARRAKLVEKKRKQLRALKPARQSLLNLLSMIGSQSNDIRNLVITRNAQQVFEPTLQFVQVT